MQRKIGNVSFLTKGEQHTRPATTGVSLHCHTLHSKELLDFVPYYISRIPIASYFWERQMRKTEELHGIRPDFISGYWTPPLTGDQVFDSEKKNLAKLGMEALVSVTDHDSIDTNLAIRENVGVDLAPISLEWTVPFEEGFFHVGVHNLPPDNAESISSLLIEHTRSEGAAFDRARLNDLFEMLNDLPDVLVILNHPIWDIEMIGQEAHERLLGRFMAEHSGWIHAIEINGFRDWKENEAAAELAESLGLPAVSGGDRHCLQPNTMINTTDAASFSEFAHEVRYEGFSRITVMPEYSQPLPCRQLRSIRQILGYYEYFPPGRRHWSDRVYLDHHDGNGLRTLSDSWHGRTPRWTIPVFLSLQLLTHPVGQLVIGKMIGDKDIGREDKNPADRETRTPKVLPT